MTGSDGEGRRGPVGDRGRIDPRRGYAFVRAHRAEFSISAMCRALRLSSSGYYDWLKRTSSAEPSRLDDEHRDGNSGNSAHAQWEVLPSTNPCRTTGAGPREPEAGRSVDEENGASWGRVWNVAARGNAAGKAGK